MPNSKALISSISSNLNSHGYLYNIGDIALVASYAIKANIVDAIANIPDWELDSGYYTDENQRADYLYAFFAYIYDDFIEYYSMYPDIKEKECTPEIKRLMSAAQRFFAKHHHPNFSMVTI